jgi:hypothetical protein
LWRLAEANGKVHAVSDKLAELVSGQQFELQVWITIKELAKPSPEQQSREIRIGVYAQTPAHEFGRPAGLDRRLLEAAQKGCDLRVETPALVGKADRSRGPLEQANSNTRFEPGYGPADT